jgi:hypothetical protein
MITMSIAITCCSCCWVVVRYLRQTNVDGEQEVRQCGQQKLILSIAVDVIVAKFMKLNLLPFPIQACVRIHRKLH